MLPIIVVVVFLTSTCLGGTLCPPRENIYPCSCSNIHFSKKLVHTIVHCHRLPESETLASIFNTLRSMQIDQFHLFDSFWEADKLGDIGEKRKVLPTDWLTLLKIKEMEIVDTALASCFACQRKISCKNSVTNRFTAMNASSSDKMCVLCDTGKGNKYPWTGCMQRLKHFEFSYGRLESLGVDLFPVLMKELTLVNLTHNQISKIDPDTFKNLPRLTTLDISHNLIHTIDFLNPKMNLVYLDLSWNNIQTIGNTLFSSAPFLKTLRLEYNDISKLRKEDWRAVPDSLRYIDLSDNSLHCDCNIRWINGTFHVNSILLGTCATPDDYENSALRKASRMLIERCDEEGNIGTRKRSSTTTPLHKLLS